MKTKNWCHNLRLKLLIVLCAVMLLGQGLFIAPVPAQARGVAVNPARAAVSSGPPNNWLQVVSWGPDRLDIFTRSAYDGGIWVRTYDGGWYPWTSLGKPVGVSAFSSIEAISWGSPQLDVFGVDYSRVVWHRSWSGTSWGFWENIGNVGVGGGGTSFTDTGGIQAVSWIPGRIDLFASGTYSASGNGTSLQHKWFNIGHGWGPSQTGWESIGTVTPGAGYKADVVAWGPNRLDIIKRSQNNSISWQYYNGSGWVPSPPALGKSLGGASLSTPTVVSWAPNRLDVFARGTDGVVYSNGTPDGTNWYGWYSLGGGGSTDYNALTADAWGPNRLDVFENRGGWIMHKWWDGSAWGPYGTAGPWEFLGGDTESISAPPVVVSWSAGRLDLFEAVPSGHIWHKWYQDGWGWGPDQVDWEDIGGPP